MIPARSCSRITAPVGLQGELRITPRVRSVAAALISSNVGRKWFSGEVVAKTGVPPANETWSGKLTQYGDGMITSSPARTSASIRLNSSCFPPLPAITFSAASRVPQRVLYRLAIPSRRAFVPLAFVYFVKPRSIARLPASPTAAGVAKSGSPGPKSTTSTPWAMRAVARLRTASVGDSCIAETRSEKRMPARAVVVISGTGSFLSPFRRRGEASRPGLAQPRPRSRRLAAHEHPHDLDATPPQIDVDHLLAERRNAELDEPEREENDRV